MNSPLVLQGVIGGILGAVALGVWWLWQRRKETRPPKEKQEGLSPSLSPDLVDRTDQITLDLETKGVLSAKDGRLLRQAVMSQVQKPKSRLVGGKYSAFAFTEEGIKFLKIPERVGNIVQLEPSMPKHGAHYMVIEKNEGQYEPYDPRLSPLLSEETPLRAFEAVNWYREVNAVYANKFGLWDKINTFLIGFGIAVMGIVAIVGFDKLGK